MRFSFQFLDFKVDAGLSVVVDVQNTLVAPLVIRLGNEEQKQKYLPKLCTEWVFFHIVIFQTKGINKGSTTAIQQVCIFWANSKSNSLPIGV